jgi:cysteinyl-tRNA synthetase
MSRKLEEFRPIIPNRVDFYSCGPTVYWDQHLGNMRTFISNDMIKRMFIENGYAVRHVMNYTDVGHLTSDEDEGEDKMEKGARRENKTVWEIAQMYIDSVESDFQELNIIKPITPRATDYIDAQIDLVRRLEELGYTYIIPGNGVYYDTSKFAA